MNNESKNGGMNMDEREDLKEIFKTIGEKLGVNDYDYEQLKADEINNKERYEQFVEVFQEIYKNSNITFEIFMNKVENVFEKKENLNENDLMAGRTRYENPSVEYKSNQMDNYILILNLVGESLGLKNIDYRSYKNLGLRNPEKKHEFEERLGEFIEGLKGNKVSEEVSNRLDEFRKLYQKVDVKAGTTKKDFFEYGEDLTKSIKKDIDDARVKPETEEKRETPEKSESSEPKISQFESKKEPSKIVKYLKRGIKKPINVLTKGFAIAGIGVLVGVFATNPEFIVLSAISGAYVIYNSATKEKGLLNRFIKTIGSKIKKTRTDSKEIENEKVKSITEEDLKQEEVKLENEKETDFTFNDLTESQDVPNFTVDDFTQTEEKNDFTIDDLAQESDKKTETETSNEDIKNDDNSSIPSLFPEDKGIENITQEEDTKIINDNEFGNDVRSVLDEIKEEQEYYEPEYHDSEYSLYSNEEENETKNNYDNFEEEANLETDDYLVEENLLIKEPSKKVEESVNNEELEDLKQIKELIEKQQKVEKDLEKLEEELQGFAHSDKTKEYFELLKEKAEEIRKLKEISKTIKDIEVKKYLRHPYENSKGTKKDFDEKEIKSVNNNGETQTIYLHGDNNIRETLRYDNEEFGRKVR